MWWLLDVMKKMCVISSTYQIKTVIVWKLVVAQCFVRKICEKGRINI